MWQFEFMSDKVAEHAIDRAISFKCIEHQLDDVSIACTSARSAATGTNGLSRWPGDGVACVRINSAGQLGYQFMRISCVWPKAVAMQSFLPLKALAVGSMQSRGVCSGYGRFRLT
jgi:hypothetical protein